MNDEDLRDLFAGLAMIGLSKDTRNVQHTATWCYKMADAMIEAKYAEEKPEEGITAIKPKRKRSVNVTSTTD